MSGSRRLSRERQLLAITSLGAKDQNERHKKMQFGKLFAIDLARSTLQDPF